MLFNSADKEFLLKIISSSTLSKRKKISLKKPVLCIKLRNFQKRNIYGDLWIKVRKKSKNKKKWCKIKISTRKVCTAKKWVKNRKEHSRCKRGLRRWSNKKLCYLIDFKLHRVIRKKHIHPWNAWSPSATTIIPSVTTWRREKYRKCPWHNNLLKHGWENSRKVHKVNQIWEQVTSHMCLAFRIISAKQMASSK